MLREIELEIPIRYASGDAVEKWLHDLLCLDVAKTGLILRHIYGSAEASLPSSRSAKEHDSPPPLPHV